MGWFLLGVLIASDSDSDEKIIYCHESFYACKQMMPDGKGGFKEADYKCRKQVCSEE